MRRNNKGLFRKLEEFLGEKPEIHHIIEQRFWNNAPKNSAVRRLFEHQDNIPGIVLSKSRHQIITKRWTQELKKKGMSGFRGYDNITIEDLINAVGRVYRDDPLQMQVAKRVLMKGLTL